MVLVKLRHVVEDVDRHGNVRVYVRVPGHKKVRLQEMPGTDAFLREYELAMANAPTAKPALNLATLRGLCATYYLSQAFKALDKGTQTWRRRSLDRISVTEGDKPVALMAPKHIRRLRDELADTPGASDMRLKALKALFVWAIGEDHLTQNPARDVPKLRHLTHGFHTWTEDEITAFIKRHPLGTQAHLAMVLILFTAGRREDAVRLGPQHIKNGRLRFTQAKNEHRKPVTVDLPVHPMLAAAIKAAPSGHLTFLVTVFGRPFTAPGFGNKFRDWCDQAGLPQCAAHGLRKAIATRLAEAGATEHEIMAVTGHQSPEQVKRYTAAASRSKMADGGFSKL